MSNKLEDIPTIETFELIAVTKSAKCEIKPNKGMKEIIKDIGIYSGGEE